MSKKKNKRTENIPMVRLTIAERKQLINEYRSSGYNYFTRFIRDKILTKKSLKNPEKIFLVYAELGKIRGEYNKVGNNLNQIAFRLNATKGGKLERDDVKVIKEFMEIHRLLIAKIDEL